MLTQKDIFGYAPDPQYAKPVAYFSMEFAIHYALQIYSGGLGFLAGSHMRSAYELKQNLIGIGLLYKYGYYDQERNGDRTMVPRYIEKHYHFLTDTGIVFKIPIHAAQVHVKAYLLKPEVFGTAPVFLLSTDIPENDAISRTITERLYDPNEATRVAQSMVLGIGGAKLIDELGLNIDIYHMNEGHGLPLCFYLYDKYKSKEEVKKRVVFTTHTPEKAGNEERSVSLLDDMNFFYTENKEPLLKELNIWGDKLDYTLAAMKFSKIANGVSQLHGEVAREMWADKEGVPNIIAITNAQNKKYWKDDVLEDALAKDDNALLVKRKKELKKQLFNLVAAQCGRIFDENVLTIVWARRFAGYKRANLLMRDFDKFKELVDNAKYPVQIIWAGKPYPEDHDAIGMFNDLIRKSALFKNTAVLTGYELFLSALLKKGSDVWLNNPRMYREASGTSGMTAAMNASINLSIPDGWVPEFAKDGENSFIIPVAPKGASIEEQDKTEYENLYNVLHEKVIPLYYEDQDKWLKITKQAMKEVVPFFDSDRMADEYYKRMYNS